jgi:hypothetical protein
VWGSVAMQDAAQFAPSRWGLRDYEPPISTGTDTVADVGCVEKSDGPF